MAGVSWPRPPSNGRHPAPLASFNPCNGGVNGAPFAQHAGTHAQLSHGWTALTSGAAGSGRRSLRCDTASSALYTASQYRLSASAGSHTPPPHAAAAAACLPTAGPHRHPTGSRAYKTAAVRGRAGTTPVAAPPVRQSHPHSATRNSADQPGNADGTPAMAYDAVAQRSVVVITNAHHRSVSVLTSKSPSQAAV